MSDAVQAQLLMRNGGPSLYLQVVDHLRNRITDGTWRPGDKLPSIELLMEEFAVARITIRDAVRVLTDEGLLEPSRGKGTIVTDRAKGYRPLKLPIAFDQFVKGLKNDRPVPGNVKQATVSPTLTGARGKPATSYEFIERTHMRDDVSYCLISLYLDRRIYSKVPLRFQRELVLPVLKEKFPSELVSVEQKMRFGKCDSGLAERLQYPYGDPVAHMTRVICNADDLIIYYAHVSYRADFLELDFGTHRW